MLAVTECILETNYPSETNSPSETDNSSKYKARVKMNKLLAKIRLRLPFV